MEQQPSKEQLENALNEARICLESAFGMLAPFYNEETLFKIKDAYLKSIDSKLMSEPDAQEN